MLALTIGYTGITRGTNYAHYTSWSFTLCTVYMVTDLFARKHVSPLLAPLAYAVSQSVACLTAGMYAADSGLVREAYRDNNDVLVEFANLALHVFPATVVMLWLAHTRTDLAACKMAQRADYNILCVLVTLSFCAVYFYSFSPRHQYMVVINNTYIRSITMLIHAVFAALGAWGTLCPRDWGRTQNIALKIK